MSIKFVKLHKTSYKNFAAVIVSDITGTLQCFEWAGITGIKLLVLVVWYIDTAIYKLAQYSFVHCCKLHYMHSDVRG